MSVIACDGKILAADTLGISGDLKLPTSKIRLIFLEGKSFYVGWTGQLDHGEALIDWYVSGAIKEKYPAFQSTNDWTRLIVIKNDFEKLLTVMSYEQTPYPIYYSIPVAWGSGRDYALGAMAMGADARKAVEIACTFSASCGLPVESHDLRIVK